MKTIFDDNENIIETSKLLFLSNKGQECVVYKYYNEVIKIFKKDYKLQHITKENIEYLENIKTKRILMPTGYIKDEKEKLIGYKMKYINGSKDINNENTYDVINALEALRDDVEILSNKKVILLDINANNMIFNGKLYLIDPGNYMVGKDKSYNKVRQWNYDKINKLIDELLFSKKFNLYQLRLIVQFFNKERENNHTNYNLDIIKKYFEPSLKIKDGISKFVRYNIKDDPKEKEFFEKIMEDFNR